MGGQSNMDVLNIIQTLVRYRISLTTFNEATCISLLSSAIKGNVVEIGTKNAGTTAIIGASVPDSSLVYSIDIAASPIRQEVMDYFGLNCQFIDGDSREVVKTWDKKIDLLFVDGCHSDPEDDGLSGCLADLTLWVPFVNSGGYVLIHDYVHRCANEKNPTIMGVHHDTKNYLSSNGDLVFTYYVDHLAVCQVLPDVNMFSNLKDKCTEWKDHVIPDRKKLRWK